MTELNTKDQILEAARACLLEGGYAGMSTRVVADRAGVPLSQIHYHFGSKEELILSMLRAEDERLQDRQNAMFALDLPLWKRWDLACDYFDEDIASGYVRVLQEMTAAGWSSERVGKEVREIYRGWHDMLASAAADGLVIPGFSAHEVGALVGALFVGAESLILLDMEDEGFHYRSAMRKVGDLIKTLEEGAEGEG